MSYAAKVRATGELTLAPAGSLCQGHTPYSGTSFTCGGDNGRPAKAVHTWKPKADQDARNYCAGHSPFDLTDEERVELAGQEQPPASEEATEAPEEAKPATPAKVVKIIHRETYQMRGTKDRKSDQVEVHILQVGDKKFDISRVRWAHGETTISVHVHDKTILLKEFGMKLDRD